MQASGKKDIRAFTKQELEAEFKALNEPAFKARQVYEWLWKKSAHSFDEMTSLSKSLREVLSMAFSINHIREHHVQHSNDGTIKSSFQLHDGHLIEGVLIPTDDRATACVSSQVGCSLSCKFCATGYMDRVRNLNADEIYDQVVLINRQAMEALGRPLTNIVFMGMGEPLLNYKNVIDAIAKITSEEGLHISSKRITVSTAGIAKMIRRMGEEKVKFNLALSLHAADDEKRNTIMPINEQNNIDVLVDAMNFFHQETGNEITFEYILLNGVNDGPEDAEQLAAICRRVPNIKVNIIEYNKIKEAAYSKTDKNRRDKFKDTLEKKRVVAHIRKSRGKDIDAACGQLANKG
ncbi:MAG: 23S rRNA (adenine(2503)-C(2))-methyltransferase RlmN [Chitinophagales bacterium]|nr:23S rRNA (adenine(2503)-C(2))-methyltransferase RlmN [Chitinophagales bacterium]